MQEIWKDIKDFEGLYQISNLGNVKSLGNGTSRNSKIRVLKAIFDNQGYYMVCLHKNKKQHSKNIHRLVAENFIPNPDNKPQVNHKNGIKTDNRLLNLEWCTVSQNTQHSYDNALQIKVYGLDNKLTKYKIEVYSYYTGAYITTLIGKQAIKDFGLDQSSVWKYLAGKVNHHKQYTFKKIPL